MRSGSFSTDGHIAITSDIKGIVMIRKKDDPQTRCLDRERKSKPRLILRDGSPQGHRCRARCNLAPLVKRPGRRADYETQTCQTTNVWARENCPSRSTIARCSMIRDAVIKHASEPKIGSDSHLMTFLPSLWFSNG